MKEEYVRFCGIVTFPAKIFERIRKEPRWWTAFAIILFLTMSIDCITIPLFYKMNSYQASQPFERAPFDNDVEMPKNVLLFGIVASSVFTAIRLTSVSLLVFLLTVLAGSLQTNYRSILSLLSHTEIILLLLRSLNLLIVLTKGTQSLSAPTDIEQIVGLEYFLDTAKYNDPLFVFLKGINVFKVWYLWISATGIAIVANLNRWKANCCMLIIWGGGMCLNIGIVILLGDLKNLLEGR